MEITQVNIKRLERKDNLKGIANIVLDNEFAVNEIKIIEINNKISITMPDVLLENGKYKSIVHTINNNAREKIQKAIIKEYKK